MKILLAVDSSPHSLDATKCVIEHANWFREPPQIELLTVHRPVPKIGGMGAAVKLVVHGPAFLYVILFGILSAWIQIFTDYERFVGIMKWLCL